MCEDPFLSVIVPIRNLEKYLPDCLKSFEGQDHLFSYEIVCVDNASSDRSAEVIASFADRLPLSCVREETISAAAARNAGIRAARGKYLWFVDGDDEAETGAFRALKGALRGEEQIFVFGAKVLNYSDRIRLRDITPTDNTYEGECLRAFYGEESCRPYVWNSIYRREFLLRNHLRFPEECDRAEDVVFQFFCFEMASEVRFCSQSIYRYHHLRNPDSLMAEVAGREVLRLEECLRATERIVASRERGRSEPAFGRWLYEYLLLPVLRLSDRGEKRRLMLLVRERLLTKSKTDFSALPLLDRWKAFCFRYKILLRLYFLFR